MPAPTPTLVLTAADVRDALDIGACIDVVEDAFRRLAPGDVIPPGVLGSPAPGGGFHVKTAGIRRDRLYYAAKVNANFPRNPDTRGLPTIQGVIALFDAETGELLALMDSIEITGLRTAAASAVAARHLARPDAERLLIIGCGTQGLHHARALLRVRPVSRIQLADRSPAAAERMARMLRSEVDAAVEIVDDFRAAARAADIVVTCTPSGKPLLDVDDLPPAGFVAAVGADSAEKQEIATGALARCAVVVDILDQCAEIGELRHGIAGGVMTRDDVRAELSEVVAGGAVGRFAPGETILFDSTGTALEDVAAAAYVYERAAARDQGAVCLGAEG
jgi:ornithine cyclodeaminase/alanine dehydrogenase-like protein (mu-crystallin family)